MEQFVRLRERCATRWRRFFHAVGSAVLVYASALVGVQVAELGGVEPWATVLLHAALVVVLVAVIYAATTVSDHMSGKGVDDRLHLLRRAEYEAACVPAVVQGELAKLCDGSSKSVVHVPHNPMVAIEAELGALYRTLDGSQWPVRTPGARIEFQVTFMTRSCRDGRITIAAWANRAARRPASLDRQAIDPDLYDRSVTAEVYADTRPAPRLIPSTVRAGNKYQQLYSDQKDWIRSTIIYPVLDQSTDLVGTLVASCDREDYFREEDYGFWYELMEPFAMRIALEKLRFDHAVTMSRDGQTVTSIPAPF